MFKEIYYQLLFKIYDLHNNNIREFEIQYKLPEGS